jgi:predicted nucleotidyltransferase
MPDVCSNNWNVPMIDLDPENRCLVVEILRRHVPGVDVYAFGSRVNGRARPYSDLDLLLKAPVTEDQMESIKNAFSESDLPILIDLVQEEGLSEEFKHNMGKMEPFLLHAPSQDSPRAGGVQRNYGEKE